MSIVPNKSSPSLADCFIFGSESKIHFIFVKGGGGPSNNTYIKEISISRNMLNE